MSDNAAVIVALDELHAQYDAALEDAKLKQEQLDRATALLTTLETAIRSLEALANFSSAEKSSRSVSVAELLSRNGVVSKPRWKNDPPPRELAPYVPAVGGKRLKSKRMVFDLLHTMKGPVTRDELRRLFFEHYGRENLERYWARPDNALNTAIDRAADEHIIEEIPATDGGPPRYTAGWRDSATGEPAFPDNGEDDEEGED
jgi:hypothetical protein